METDLSRSCADLKGVGGWVGGGEVVENSNFLLLGPPYGKHKYPSPEKKNSRSAHDCVYFFSHYDAMHGKCATDTLHAS